jgi:ABC-type methionine transport system permease subunit
VQLPNVPLLAALAGWLVAALTDGLVHDCARATFYAGLAAWAWKEVDDGVNWARRAIGAAGLVFVIVKIAEALRT